MGLDLLNINQIKAFFLENHNLLFNFTYLFYFLSVDKSNLNLNERNEEKKSFIKKKLSIFIEEMETISRNNKKIQLMEVNNLMKLTVEKVVFEFGIEDKKVIFEKVNLYLQEHKDIFEQNDNTNEKVEPEVRVYCLIFCFVLCLIIVELFNNHIHNFIIHNAFNCN